MVRLYVCVGRMWRAKGREREREKGTEVEMYKA